MDIEKKQSLRAFSKLCRKHTLSSLLNMLNSLNLYDSYTFSQNFGITYDEYTNLNLINQYYSIDDLLMAGPLFYNYLVSKYGSGRKRSSSTSSKSPTSPKSPKSPKIEDSHPITSQDDIHISEEKLSPLIYKSSDKKQGKNIVKEMNDKLYERKNIVNKELKTHTADPIYNPHFTGNNHNSEIIMSKTTHDLRPPFYSTPITVYP